MRKPNVKNKYNLKPKDIQKSKVLNKEALMRAPFWRNDVVSAYCLSGGCGKDVWGDFDMCYWIGFYDDDAPAYAGKIRLSLTSYGGMCGYNITGFFKDNEIENENDLHLQEILLEKINWLIDDGIISMPQK